MPYRIAGIDVHKKKLAVVVADVEVNEEYQFERRWYGSNPEQLQLLSEWLIEQQVEASIPPDQQMRVDFAGMKCSKCVNSLALEAMRRAIKLVFHEHRVTCPYCRTALIYHLLTETTPLASAPA